jgi:cell division protein FtsI/penicillin-binding protein 2
MSATVIRGGEYLPLRILDAVEQDGVRYLLPRARGKRVFKPETSVEVREMMKLGARLGTGRRVAGPDVLPGIEVGTKTGTAQKVGDELCSHVDLAHQERHWRDGSPCTRACREGLKRAPRDHSSCYTSSMCAFGRLPGTEREVMIYVVAEEPRKGKYGSVVAGPTAIAILKEALGVTRLGEATLDEVVPGFAPSNLPPARSPERPWAEGLH